ncbi:DUF6300 family protein, partial [Streptomyces sp. NPDC002589]|uniref:DUF6300 family protein n=1 Tax=Streptomyces sp. NPDC002589 TaxID=3154420 RepID=UPI0033187116
MAHVSIQRSNDLPSCSRCNGPLILAAQMPQLDASGKPISLELCRTCDAGDTAAGALDRGSVPRCRRVGLRRTRTG